MSGDLKLWPIRVQNPVTKEWVCFSGQGKTVSEAIKDGSENLHAAFRPDSSGHAKPEIGIGVMGRVKVELPSGWCVLRKIKDFESDRAFDAATEAKT